MREILFRDGHNGFKVARYKKAFCCFALETLQALSP
jgi:hypothetical protein